MSLPVKLGIGGELLLDVGKVAAHPYAVIRQWAARIDECDQQCFAMKLVDSNRLAALIEEFEIWYCLPVRGDVIGLAGLVIRPGLRGHNDLRGSTRFQIPQSK